MPDSVRPHRCQPTRLPCSWDSPGKNTGVGCHFLPHLVSLGCSYWLPLPKVETQDLHPVTQADCKISPTFHPFLSLCFLPCDFAASACKRGHLLSLPLNLDWSGVLLCTTEYSESVGVLVLALDLKIPSSLPRS